MEASLLSSSSDFVGFCLWWPKVHVTKLYPRWIDKNSCGSATMSDLADLGCRSLYWLVEPHVCMYVRHTYSTWTLKRLDSAKRRISIQTQGMYLGINRPTMKDYPLQVPEDTLWATRTSRCEPYSVVVVEGLGLSSTDSSTDEGNIPLCSG